ncbi:MAG: ligase-associated DNA damage response DEXH box helicase [Neomegalonema sp.]|nr:ligase-associated DNA damage response DEXH box helicase [Neomegalonema sp.]
MRDDDLSLLPEPFASWFAGRGWHLHPHQRAMLAPLAPGASSLLIAPTGAGKTLAGFLPSLIALNAQADGEAQGKAAGKAGGNTTGKAGGLHTLYLSPLKALASDIRRNLSTPIEQMGLTIRVEDRTGDTASHVRARQRVDPPDILLTTPESLALLLSQPHAERLFAGLRRVIVDEIHALAGTKRGDQLALCLGRLRTLAPEHQRVGLSATSEDPGALAEWLEPGRTQILYAAPGPDPDIRILEEAGDPPWAGMGGRYAARAVMAQIARARHTIVFINTRAQAELFFQALWAENDANLPIGLHHGSLGREARQRVEAAMAEGALRAVVATGSLDLGIDWGDVDLVIQVGAPKAVKRLVQRIGRAGHRFDTPSRALLVPANRFELLECRAALRAVREGALDGEPMPPGSLDTLCQHLLLTACAGPFEPEALFAEVQGTGAYRALARADFDACLAFCATGGYALRAYDQWQRLMQRPDGLWQLRDPRSARRLRMNIGTIVEAERLKVRQGKGGRGPQIGEVEEAFASSLRVGDTFLIGGRVVRFDALRDLVLEVSDARAREPKIPVFAGGKLPISTLLAERVLAILAEPNGWADLPEPVAQWLRLQQQVSQMPSGQRLLVETFPRAGCHHLVAYGFAGRNAHQTLGFLLSKRLEESGHAPLGFVATDYAVMLWGLHPVEDPAPLFGAEGLREGLDLWLSGSAVMKRTFRSVATVAGLIERRLPGLRKSGRQATFSSDILYDTLRRFDPDHLMLRITRREAMRGLVDFSRIEEMLRRIEGKIEHRALARISPLAVPLMLEMGREPIRGGTAEEALLEAQAASMLESAPHARG